MTRLDDFQLTASGGVSSLSFPAASPALEKFGFKVSSGGAHISPVRVKNFETLGEII